MEPLSWPLFRGKVNVDFMDRAACSSWMVQPNLSCWPIASCQWPSKRWWYHSHYLAFTVFSARLCFYSIFIQLDFLQSIFVQPDYEQQAMEESRFRQQLEARNKAGKKSEKKHGERQLLISLKILFSKSDNNCFRWPLLLWSARTNPQLCQVEGAEGEGGEIRSDWWAARQGGASHGLARASERLPREWWAAVTIWDQPDFLLPRDEPAGTSESPGPNLRRVQVETPGPWTSARPAPQRR